MIDIQNLHKKFNKNIVLSGLDLHIKEGGIIAVLGPNGSGKTTLIKSILGMVIPNKGEIRVLGENIKNQSFYRNKIYYSGGTKQKVNIVLTFMFDSPLIILDEPTSGLDPISLIRLKKLIQTEKERGKTILITSHIMSFVEEVSDEIVFLLEGEIYFKGSINELKTKTNQPDFEHAIASILTENHA